MTEGAQRLLWMERNTADLDRATAFYHDTVGFHVDVANAPPPAWTLLPGLCDTPPRCARLSLGAQQIVLTEFRNAAPCPAGSTACDLWFQHCAIAVSAMDDAYRQVMQHDAVTPITRGGPQTLPPSTGSVTAFKFRDPDGHPLELISFPAGTGDPVWQSVRAGSPMLGIDHSAISVGDAERSMLYYELLGLRASARGLNRGIEQQCLDDLTDVEVDVIAVEPAAARTPHLELLGYREPLGRANSSAAITAIAADRLVWQTENIDVLLDALADADFAETTIASGFIGGATIALLRDPDGHLLVLTEGDTPADV